MAAGACFQSVPREALLRTCDQLEWIAPVPNGNDNAPLVVTRDGLCVSNADSAQEALRVQLAFCIKRLKPRWRIILTKGLCECQNKLPPGPAQLFKEAELFDPSVDAVREWWDDVLLDMSPAIEAANLATGRQAEKLTVEYEYRRTGRKPVWMAVELNAAGYDVLSCVEKSDTTRLRIEVKGTTAGMFGTVYFSANELEVAQSPGLHLFHLWMLGEDCEPILHELSVDDIHKHTPVNVGDGRWQSLAVPVRALIGFQQI